MSTTEWQTAGPSNSDSTPSEECKHEFNHQLSTGQRWCKLCVRWIAGSGQPDLPLGHPFVPCRRLHGRRNTHNCANYEHCDECGEFESAHRRRKPDAAGE